MRLVMEPKDVDDAIKAWVQAHGMTAPCITAHWNFSTSAAGVMTLENVTITEATVPRPKT